MSKLKEILDTTISSYFGPTERRVLNAIAEQFDELQARQDRATNTAHERIDAITLRLNEVLDRPPSGVTPEIVKQRLAMERRIGELERGFDAIQAQAAADRNFETRAEQTEHGLGERIAALEQSVYDTLSAGSTAARLLALENGLHATDATLGDVQKTLEQSVATLEQSVYGNDGVIAALRQGLEEERRVRPHLERRIAGLGIVCDSVERRVTTCADELGIIARVNELTRRVDAHDKNARLATDLLKVAAPAPRRFRVGDLVKNRKFDRGVGTIREINSVDCDIKVVWCSGVAWSGPDDLELVAAPAKSPSRPIKYGDRVRVPNGDIGLVIDIVNTTAHVKTMHNVGELEAIDLETAAPAPRPIQVGDRVRVPDLNLNGNNTGTVTWLYHDGISASVKLDNGGRACDLISSLELL